MENLFDSFALSLSMRWVRDSSVHFYIDYLKNFLKFWWYWVECFWHPIKFHEAYSRIFKRDISANTKKKYLISARIFSDFLLKKWLIEVNYAREQKCPKIQKQIPCALTRTELEIVYSAINSRWSGHLRSRNRMILDFFVYTWLRRWEVANMRRSDILRDRVLVRQWKWWKDRVVFIPDDFSTKLQEYMNSTSSEYLFHSRRWWKLQDRSFHTIMKVISDTTWKKVYPHILRHTYASNCVIDGVDLYTVQQQLGHTDIQTTSIYLYMNDEQRLKNIQKLRCV